MRIFKNKDFNKWAKKQAIKDSSLEKAVREMNDGLYDANLGGGVYKKRIAYGGKGKSGGIRTILTFQIGKRAFFIYGFAKNEIDNITQKDEVALKKLAKMYFNFTQKQIDAAIDSGELIEVKYEEINTKSRS